MAVRWVDRAHQRPPMATPVWCYRWCLVWMLAGLVGCAALPAQEGADASPADEAISTTSPVQQDPRAPVDPVLSHAAPVSGLVDAAAIDHIADQSSAVENDAPTTVPGNTAVVTDGTMAERGNASWYGKRFHRRRTASGEPFDMHAFTAAHRTLPFGTKVCVRGARTAKAIEVRITDRGPHMADRIIDLSYAAAKALDVVGSGMNEVEIFPVTFSGGKQGCDASVASLR